MALYDLRKNPIHSDEGDPIQSAVERQLDLAETKGSFATIASLLETIGVDHTARSTSRALARDTVGESKPEVDNARLTPNTFGVT